MRASVIHTFDGAEVVVPNGDLVAKDVINWTLSDQQRRVELEVRVPDGTNVTDALEILKRVAAGHPDVLETPAPMALMKGFSEGSLVLHLLAWTGINNMLAVSSDLNVRVYEALEQAGIRAAVPQRDLHVRSVAPGAALVVDGIASTEGAPKVSETR